MRPDHLALGRLITQRLKAEIQDVRNIALRSDLPDLSGQGLVSPSLYVIYVRDAIPQNGDAPDGMEHLVQQWMVVLAVQGTPDQLLTTAGDLLAKVREALLGWSPDPGLYDPIKGATPPAAIYPNGWGFFPLMFNADFYA
ncbi:hypothetical protein [uncultured Aquitalea sp.]|uniref:phage tail terminator protein n=1 Tax=uncultured Aquitalea sp. TaxID=540272 RepID=UPI0025D6EFE6|nr:hypothetical protein [uncultured Aquitalea sp.]